MHYSKTFLYSLLFVLCFSFSAYTQVTGPTTPSIMPQPPIIIGVAPATPEEMIQDIDRYVELFASRNALFSLHSLDYILYFGDQAIPALLKGLKHQDSQVRCLSAIALSKLPDKRAIPLLFDLLNDPNGLDLQTLSDDGRFIHSSYGSELPFAVRENALRTLQIITGMNFGDLSNDAANNQAVIQRWRDWWIKEQNQFQLPQPIRFSNRFSDVVRYPIPDYARYLEGITVCIDPGHGGDASQIGYKRGPSGNRESESNLRLSRYLRDFLTACGAKVLMTRDSDKDVPLTHRTAIANQHQADIFISIHHNWSPRYTSQATTIWYHATADYNPASMDLGRYIFQEFTQEVALREVDKAMGLKSDYLMYENAGFAVLRTLAPEIPGVLCELAYFSNLETELKMRNSDFLQQEAYGVFLGIAKYFYAGVPHWKIISPDTKSPVRSPVTELAIQVYDGLEARKEWGYGTRIFHRHLIAELDGKPVPFTMDEKKGILRIALSTPLSTGRHSLQLWIININKNHNWPQVHWFVVE